MAGCGKKAGPPGSTPSAAASVAEPVMTAWQQGDRSTAISSFLQTDWTSRPLFASSSALGLTEDQFKALSPAQQQADSAEIYAQLESLNELAKAVVQVGRDAAATGDKEQARKYFASVKQFGGALSSPDCTRIVQLVGRAVVSMGDKELAKIGQ